MSNEEHGFRRIGSLLPPTESLPSATVSTPTPSPTSSGTTGMPEPGQGASSSTGPQHGGIGAGARNLPASTTGMGTVSRKASPDLQPAPPGWISARVTALLHHYWMPEMSRGVAEAVAADWQEVLGGYPKAVIRAACEDWLRAETRRPTPADIRKLCQDHMPRRPAPPVYHAAELEPPGEPLRPDVQAALDEFRRRLAPPPQKC